MRMIATWTLAAWMGIVPAIAAPKPKPPAKPKPPTTSQLQAQVKKLTQERDELKERLAATEDLQQELSAAGKSRDLARQELEALRKELNAIKSSLNENQSGAESILQELQQARSTLAVCTGEKESLKKELEDTRSKTKPQNTIADFIPARAINLNRVTPKVSNVDRGVVVVNVLISENGDVVDARLVQGLPGNDATIQKAHEACVEAAKRLVFDPARSVDGKTKLRIWQAVGFLVD